MEGQWLRVLAHRKPEWYIKRKPALKVIVGRYGQTLYRHAAVYRVVLGKHH